MGRAWLYSLTILIGLWVSATAFGGLMPDNVAEWPVNIWCWSVFGYIYKSTNRKERIEMLLLLTILNSFLVPVLLIRCKIENLKKKYLKIAKT